MYVKRGTAASWRQRAFENQHDLAIGLAHPAQPQNFSRMPILQLQKITHNPSSHSTRLLQLAFLARCLPGIGVVRSFRQSPIFCGALDSRMH
jgi:hypothetical protein